MGDSMVPFRRRQCIVRLFLSLAFCMVLVVIIYNFTGGIQPRQQILHEAGSTLQLTVESDQNDEQKLPEIVKFGGDPSDGSANRSGQFRQNLGFCKIPKLEVNGKEVIKFYKKFPPLVCKKGQPKPWVFVDEQRRIQQTEHAKRVVSAECKCKIECKWSFYDRINDRELSWTAEEGFEFGDKITKGDFFKVICSAGTEKWTNPFMVVVPRQKQAANVSSQIQQKNSKLNVYILSFDSLSQMAFRRNLPKTVHFLENVMKSAVLNGYNIVGDGTPQAFIPILTAQTEEELPLTRKRYSQAHFVDEVYPFVWTNFSNAGYATLYGEDGHGIGTFTYRLKGFKERPTDHFPITFFQYTESLPGSRVCIGAEKQHNVWFRYIESFWREYGDLGVPRFSLLHHSCLSHDDLNRVQQVDDDLVDHLTRMQLMGAFDHSLVILMADHGSRFSELRNSHQGQLEERLPFFSVHLPAIIRESADQRLQLAWQNLRLNSDRLSSPFDIHQTLMDVLRWPLPLEELNMPNNLPETDEMESAGKLSKLPPAGRSLSLFREIPLNRTCDQAGIEPHWCTCLQWQPVADSKESNILARSVVKLINDYTKPERTLCAPLKLHRVIRAKKLVPNESLLRYSGTKDKDGFVPELKGGTNTTFATYQIVLETRPGNAHYEVTLFYDGKQVTVDWTAISHINKFGDTPHCIIDKNYFMASYCVCYDRVNAN